MTLLPGWDSSAFVRAAHRDLEFISIIGFVVCAGCEFVKHVKPSHGKLVERLVTGSFLFAAFMELIAFPYGERNDELAREQANKQDFAISELSTRAQEALGKAKEALDDSNSAVSKAADSERFSGRAIDKSGQAEKEASSALILAKGARTEADTFKHEIELAKEQATSAEASAERERIVRADRELSGVEKTRLLSKISSFDKTITYRFNSRIGDSDAKRYADNIAAVLSSAGLRVTPSDGLMANAELVGTWVGVSSKAPESVKTAADQMLNSLRAAGLPHVNRTALGDKSLNVDIGVVDLIHPLSLSGVEILIGRKPREGE